MRKVENETPAPPVRILIVDDNRNGLAARKAVLEESKFTVHACNTPEDALNAFRDSVFDLVVTDYRMPKMNGIELIVELRALRPAVPIIMISGMVDAIGLTEKSTGADIVIAKNAAEIQHLLRSVNRLLKPAARKPAASEKRGPLKGRKQAGQGS